MPSPCTALAACYLLKNISVCARMSQIRAKLVGDSEGSNSCTAGAQTDQSGTCTAASSQEQFWREGAQEELNPATKIFLILTLPLLHSGSIGEISYWTPKNLNNHSASNGLRLQWNIAEHTISTVKVSLSFKASPAQFQVAKPEGWIWKPSCIHFTELLWSDAALLATPYLNTTILEQWTHIQVSLHWSTEARQWKGKWTSLWPSCSCPTANPMCFVSSDAFIEWAASSDWGTAESTGGIC